jgi:hypothetical protein
MLAVYVFKINNSYSENLLKSVNLYLCPTHMKKDVISLIIQISYIKANWKVTQPILKYLLMVEIQNNLTGLIYIHTAAIIQDPRHVTPCCNLLMRVQQSKCKDVFLTNATKSSLLIPGTSFLLNRMSSGIHFPIQLCQTNQQYLIWWSVSMTGILHQVAWNTRKK